MVVGGGGMDLSLSCVLPLSWDRLPLPRSPCPAALVPQPLSHSPCPAASNSSASTLSQDGVTPLDLAARAEVQDVAAVK